MISGKSAHAKQKNEITDVTRKEIFDLPRLGIQYLYTYEQLF